MFVARWQEAERIMDVHPAYVSDRFRPGNNMPDAPVTIETEKEAERSKEEEREAAATLSQKKAEAQKEGAPVVVTDDAAAASSSEINIDAFIKFFNQTMQEARAVIPQIQCLQGKRLEALRARCHEFSMQVIRDAARSPFLSGNGSRGWRARCTTLGAATAPHCVASPATWNGPSPCATTCVAPAGCPTTASSPLDRCNSSSTPSGNPK